MNLIIVESPAKCKKIESFLDKSYKVEATFGHLRQLSSLNDIDDDFNITFQNIKEKFKQIKKLKELIDKSSQVIIATDNDREGEAIAWHVTQLFNLPINTKRIIFNEITKDAITSALQNPTTLDINIVESQQTRQILDIFVGFKISPFLWKNVSAKNNLSAGRCQTPALNLIYENYLDHKNSIPLPIYNTIGYFTSKNIEFKLNKQFENSNDVLDLLNNCKSRVFNMNHHDTKQCVRSPPKPFITSTIQQKCSTLYHISPKETMSICQSLYESGFITYMRTDSFHLSNEFVNSTNKYISSNYGNKYWKLEMQNQNSKSNAHEAIRPTNVKCVNLTNSSPKENKIYKLIWTQTVQSLMTNAIIDETKFIIPYDDKTFFSHTTETIVFDGWMILEKKETNDYSNYLFSLNPNNIVCKKITSKGGVKNTVNHYNEATLVKKLESLGIGRPSTYCSIVEKIKDRKYVEKKNIEGTKMNFINFELVDNNIQKIPTDTTIGNEKNKYVITPLGIMVIESLMKNFKELFDYNFTSLMEEECDEIANGKKSKLDISNNYKTIITDMVNHVDSNDKYMIDDNHEFIIGKNGPVLKCKENGKTIFKNVIDNIDFEKIKNKSYKLEDILVENNDRNLGIFEDKDVILKKGKYGNYIVYNGKNISLTKLNKKFENIHLVDVIELLNNNDNNIIREFSNNLKIMNGQYGHFIYYKTDKMKKPNFISLKNFNEDYLTCDEFIIQEYIQVESNKPKKFYKKYK